MSTMDQPLFREIKSGGAHSWDCQDSTNDRIQRLIDNGFWITDVEHDEDGNMIVVTELYGMSETPMVDIGELVFVHGKPNVVILKFKLS